MTVRLGMHSLRGSSITSPLTRHGGKVIVSGYHSDLYNDALADWHHKDIRTANHAAGGKHKRTMTEC